MLFTIIIHPIRGQIVTLSHRLYAQFALSNLLAIYPIGRSFVELADNSPNYEDIYRLLYTNYFHCR